MRDVEQVSRLREVQRLRGEASDLLDDFGPLTYQQRCQLSSARSYVAALGAVLDQLDLALRRDVA